jgi:hypothetical protein
VLPGVAVTTPYRNVPSSEMLEVWDGLLQGPAEVRCAPHLLPLRPVATTSALRALGSPRCRPEQHRKDDRRRCRDEVCSWRLSSVDLRPDDDDDDDDVRKEVR